MRARNVLEQFGHGVSASAVSHTVRNFLACLRCTAASLLDSSNAAAIDKIKVPNLCWDEARGKEDKYPKYRKTDIMSALEGGLKFIEEKQRPDGSWEGCCAVCFTYGAWFALEAYACMGYTYSLGTDVPSVVRKGCEFLVCKQMDDGGWGENFESCEVREYVNSETSQVVNTCWALLGLMAVHYPDVKLLENGIKVILSRQLPNGDWPQENVCGVYNKSSAVCYTNYKNVFPIWTLGRFARLHPESDLVMA